MQRPVVEALFTIRLLALNMEEKPRKGAERDLQVQTTTETG